jgi:tetratricopeptide (TPR) repeat protein
MAKASDPVVGSKDNKGAAPAGTGKDGPLLDANGRIQQSKEVTPNWEKILYSPDRVEKWVKGEMSLQELQGITGPEMLGMAMVGFQFYEQGKFDEAGTIFVGLNALDPKESYYVTALGAVHLAQDHLDAALTCFNLAIQLNAKEVASYVNRGEVYLRQGKILEAAQDFRRAVELDPKGADPLTHRARVLAAAALEMIEQAQKEGGGEPAGKKAAAKPAAKPAAAPAKKAAPAAKASGKKK